MFDGGETGDASASVNGSVKNSVLTLPDGSKLEINSEIKGLPKNLFSSEENHDPELLD